MNPNHVEHYIESL